MEVTLDDYKLSCELIGHSADVRTVETTGKSDKDDNEMILSGSRDKTVKLWKRAGKEYCESITYHDHKNFVSCVCYLPESEWICTGSNDTTICIYKIDGYVPILRLEGHESTVCSISSGCARQTLISGSWDKTARIWTIDEMGAITFVILRGHEAAVWAVACQPAVQKYITGSADKSIFYWNAKGERLRMLKGHTDCVRGILALSDNSLVSCANDATIRYWNEDGECVREMNGHANYIYCVKQNKALGEKIIVSCGEDSTLRMWNLADGKQMGDAILHPAQSVWSVVCLTNGDIVTGCSDGIVRVFTKDKDRFANDVNLKAFTLAIETRKAQMSEDLGGIKKTDLPGPESLLTNGTREGQTKMVRMPDGTIKCYSWELGKWNLVGDVAGASGGSQATSGKTLFEGKEYDYVFSVDIADDAPPLKLPYNRGEDPWHAAQAFIHKNDLPQVYLDQVANFIIKNSSDTNGGIQMTSTSSYQDPFTGGSRYVPGSSDTNFRTTGNVDPFTGSSSYSTQQSKNVDVNFVKGSEHFPTSKYITFDNCDTAKVLEKLKEFNNKLTEESRKVPESALEAIIKLAQSETSIDSVSLEALKRLLCWPADLLFPVLDIVRLAVRHEAIYSTLDSINFLDTILPQIATSAANQLMILRCLTNMMCHESGRKQVLMRLPGLVAEVSNIKTGSANLQIAIASFYLNVTITQITGVANAEICRSTTEGLIELLKWALDLEACYRSMQAIGNFTTTPFGQEVSALVISVDYVMDKLRELAQNPQAGAYAKLNAVGNALLAAF